MNDQQSGGYNNTLNMVLLYDKLTQLARQALFEVMDKIKKNSSIDSQLSDVLQESVVINVLDKYLDTLDKKRSKTFFTLLDKNKRVQ